MSGASVYKCLTERLIVNYLKTNLRPEFIVKSVREIIGGNVAQREPMWIIGWREWVALPDFNVDAIKAKIDTGARSSALHAFNLKRFRRRGKRMVRFAIHPIQRTARGALEVEAEVIEYRRVRSSNGKVESRPVIRTSVRMHNRDWEIELTLTNRDEMGFRMLLGRHALRGQFLVDPGRSLRAGYPVNSKT